MPILRVFQSPVDLVPILVPILRVSQSGRRDAIYFCVHVIVGVIRSERWEGFGESQGAKIGEYRVTGFVRHSVLFFLGIVVGVAVVVRGEVLRDGGCVYGDILVGGGSKLLLPRSRYAGRDGVGAGPAGDIRLRHA